jgi:hypothetical protein
VQNGSPLNIGLFLLQLFNQLLHILSPHDWVKMCSIIFLEKLPPPEALVDVVAVHFVSMVTVISSLVLAELLRPQELKHWPKHGTQDASRIIWVVVTSNLEGARVFVAVVNQAVEDPRNKLGHETHVACLTPSAPPQHDLKDLLLHQFDVVEAVKQETLLRGVLTFLRVVAESLISGAQNRHTKGGCSLLTM